MMVHPTRHSPAVRYAHARAQNQNGRPFGAPRLPGRSGTRHTLAAFPSYDIRHICNQCSALQRCPFATSATRSFQPGSSCSITNLFPARALCFNTYIAAALRGCTYSKNCPLYSEYLVQSTTQIQQPPPSSLPFHSRPSPKASLCVPHLPFFLPPIARSKR